MAEEKPFVNVLLLGESGAGKSTFINSFANYIRQENLPEALLHDPEFCIPARFVITDQKYNETIVSVGDYKASSYKAGKSVTQEVADYIFELNDADVKLRLIDTPGVGDSRGVQQDEKNIKAIVTSIAKYRHLNAIAFVLKSNVTVLNEYFKFCIDHLLSQLDKAAYKNVIFIFTHSRGTFYRPGETLSVIQRVLKESRVDIPHSKENMFCLDNEAFRYLVAHSRGLRFTEQEAKAFEDSWNQSVACCRSLLHYIVGDDKKAGLKPHLIKVIGEIKSKDKLQELFGFLADLSCGLDDNLEILNYFQKGVKRNFEAIPLVYFDKALPTGEEVYICRSLKCTPLHKIAERGIDVNNTSICVLNTGNTRLNCIVCKCPIDFHRSKKYLKKFMYETVVQTYEKPSKTKPTKITMLISSYEYELKNVLDVLAALMIYIMQNYNCIEDPFIVYLRNEKHVDYKNLKFLYYKIKGPKETYTKRMKLEVISNGLKNLKKLNTTGAAIKAIFGDDFNINTDVTIEDKVKKIVATTAENLQVSVANSQGKDNKNQEFNEKYKNAPKIGQRGLQLTNYGLDKPFSYADATNSKSIDANQMQLNKVQAAITKINLNPTETIITQTSTSKETGITNQALLNEIKSLKEQNSELNEQQENFEMQIKIMKQEMQYINREFDSIKRLDAAKNQELIDRVEKLQKSQENLGKYQDEMVQFKTKLNIIQNENEVLKLEINQIKSKLNDQKNKRNSSESLHYLEEAGAQPRNETSNLENQQSKLKHFPEGELSKGSLKEMNDQLSRLEIDDTPSDHFQQNNGINRSEKENNWYLPKNKTSKPEFELNKSNQPQTGDLKLSKEETKEDTLNSIDDSKAEQITAENLQNSEKHEDEANKQEELENKKSEARPFAETFV